MPKKSTKFGSQLVTKTKNFGEICQNPSEIVNHGQDQLHIRCRSGAARDVGDLALDENGWIISTTIK